MSGLDSIESAFDQVSYSFVRQPNMHYLDASRAERPRQFLPAASKGLLTLCELTGGSVYYVPGIKCKLCPRTFNELPMCQDGHSRS